MNALFDLLGDPGFQRIFYRLSIVSFVMALGMIAVALVYYNRAREPLSDDKVDARWTLLFATWRDSLIITLLYIGEGFGFDMANFQGISQVFPDTMLFYAPVAQPMISFVIHILIFVITALRIIAITRWLARP